jgi:hypothetical protein
MTATTLIRLVELASGMPMHSMLTSPLRGCVAGVAGWVLFACMPPLSAASGAHDPHALRSGSACQVPSGSRLVARSREAIAYANREDATVAKFYGCLKSVDRRVRLDVWRHDAGFDVFTPVGRFIVSAAYSEVSYSTSVAAVVLTDLATGRFYDVHQGLWGPGNGDVATVVLKRNGSVAFLTVTEPDVLYKCEIRTCYNTEGEGVPVKLDRGRISPQSLRLDGSKLRWRNASGPRATNFR